MDKIYINTDEKNIYFLDCTRVNGSNLIISRKEESLDDQIIRIAKEIGKKEIILADDVVFSGSVLREIIRKFNLLGIKTVGIISSICTEDSYRYFNTYLKYGIMTNYLMMDNVIDQICERDFYFGIAGSGIMIKVANDYLKSPYFKPFGNPYERASIPIEYEKYFSKGCLYRSIFLWTEINKLKGTGTLIRELPERIIRTNENEEVVKTLKKEMKRL